MKRQRLKALGEAPLEATYEFNPRIEQNQEILSLSDSEKKSDKRGRNRRRMLERLEKPAPQTDLRIKFNQEYFSAKAHQQAKEKEWKCKGEQSLWGSQSGKLRHVLDFSFFTTNWESGSNFKQYSHVTNILSYQGLNMFLINSWRWCAAEYTLMSLAFIDLYIYQLFVLKRSLHNM